MLYGEDELSDGGSPPPKQKKSTPKSSPEKKKPVAKKTKLICKLPAPKSRKKRVKKVKEDVPADDEDSEDDVPTQDEVILFTLAFYCLVDSSCLL